MSLLNPLYNRYLKSLWSTQGKLRQRWMRSSRCPRTRKRLTSTITSIGPSSLVLYNEVADILLPTLDVSCQVLYNRLFRLSYGFNRNYCTVSQPILMEKTGLSRNTVRTGLQSLTKDGWLRIIESGNRISTTYRIMLPREQSEHINIRVSNLEPQNQTLKFRGSKIEGQI